MKKDNVKSVVVLFACCLVVALLLAAVNMVTAPIIQEAQNQSANAALLDVLPEGKNFEEITLDEKFPKIITKGYRADGGFVFQATVSGKSSGLIIMIGIDAEGKIVSTKVIADQETDSYAEKVFPQVSGTDGAYKNMTLENFEPFLVSGATLTSRAYGDAVKAALQSFTIANGGELKKTEIDVLNKLVEGLSFAEIQTDAELDSKITAVYRADATTYAFRYADGENVYLVVSDIFGNVKASAVYEGAEGATIPTDFVSEAIKELVATEIIGNVLDKTTEFENVQTEAVENTVKAEIAYTGERSFTARSLAVFKTSGGYAVLVESDGYASVANKGAKMVIATGFDNDGKITNTYVISHSESDGFGKDKVVENKDYTDKYIGIEEVPESNNKFIDSEAFATYSYTGYHNGVRTAYLAYSAVISE